MRMIIIKRKQGKNMIYCSCTGANTSILKQAIENGAQTVKDVYDLARKTNDGTSDQKCPTSSARKSCVINLAQAWQKITLEDTPPSIQKVVDRADTANSACTGQCPSCPKNQ